MDCCYCYILWCYITYNNDDETIKMTGEEIWLLSSMYGFVLMLFLIWVLSSQELLSFIITCSMEEIPLDVFCKSDSVFFKVSNVPSI